MFRKFRLDKIVFVCEKKLILDQINLTLKVPELAPIETYKVENIDSVSFETTTVPTLRDLDQNQNVTVGLIGSDQPNTPGTKIT